MNLEARKLSIIEKIVHIKNENIISKVEKILAEVKVTKKKNIFQPMSIKEFNKRIDKSMEDSKRET